MHKYFNQNNVHSLTSHEIILKRFVITLKLNLLKQMQINNI